MNKIKAILPSLKEKKRYLVFEISSKTKIKNFKALSGLIWQNSQNFLGDLGLAEAGMWILPDKWSEKAQRGMIRVNNKHVNKLKTSLALVDSFQGEEVVIRSLGVSGILKKAEAKYLSS